VGQSIPSRVKMHHDCIPKHDNGIMIAKPKPRAGRDEQI
jgi:hypothetical protein